MPFPHVGDSLKQVKRRDPFYLRFAVVMRLTGELIQTGFAGAAAPQTWRTSKWPGAVAAVMVNQEREIIEAALEESRGRISGPSGAAGKLGMPRMTLESKIKNLGINKHPFSFA